MSDNYKDKIKQQAINKMKKNKLIKEGIEKLKEQGVDTSEMEERMLNKTEKINNKKNKIKSKKTRKDKESVISGIYRIINKENGMIYIGQSKNIKTRWKNHLSDLKRNAHINLQLQSDYNKFGHECFEFKVLEQTDYNNYTFLIYLEYQYIFNFYKEGKELYNPPNNKDKIRYKIMKRLITNNINYKYQYRFDDCRDEGLLAFDFVLFSDNLDIEEIILLRPNQKSNCISNGQHEKATQHHNMKLEYCINNNLKCTVVNYNYDDNTITIDTR